MFGQTFADFPRQIQAGEIRIFLFQFLDDAKALLVVLETAVAFHQPVEHGFALVAERRMAEVVRERDGLGEVGVQLQCAGDVARDGGDLIVCVSRVRRWSPVPLRKTCVLYSSRRNAREWMTRSRSRWYCVRQSGGGSGCLRPRVSPLNCA